MSKDNERYARYNAHASKRYSFKLHVVNDRELIEKLAEVGSINGYIKRLIRQDIEREGKTMKIRRSYVPGREGAVYTIIMPDDEQLYIIETAGAPVAPDGAYDFSDEAAATLNGVDFVSLDDFALYMCRYIMREGRVDEEISLDALEDVASEGVRDYIRAIMVSEGISEPRLWYAVMTDSEDDDWGKGSSSLEEAREMVRRNLDVYPEGYIAVIDESSGNPVCVDEIHDF